MATGNASREQTKFNYQIKSSELEAIIARLQDEQTSIDESLKLYQEASKLVNELSEYLKSAKNQLSNITVSATRKK